MNLIDKVENFGPEDNSQQCVNVFFNIKKVPVLMNSRQTEWTKSKSKSSPTTVALIGDVHCFAAATLYLVHVHLLL